MTPPAAPTLALALESAVGAVRITVGVPAGAASLYVQRTAPDDPGVYVRGAAGSPVAPGAVVLRDYEAPVGADLEYAAWVTNLAGEASTQASAGPVEIPSSPSDDPWLVDIGRPSNTQRVTLDHLAELDYVVNAGVHNIIGRRDPIVTSDIALAPAFELSFYTLDEGAREKARSALGSGFPVELRTAPEQGVGVLYLAVLGWKEQRPSRIAFHAERRFAVQAQQVVAPSPTLYAPLPPVTYDSLEAAVADYAALDAAYPDYDSIAIDFDLGGGASDSEPWP